MAILGTLTLDLSAPTAQLARDLDRAQQMAKDAASKMGGVRPVWGIASSLGDELRASRSILNSSLKAIESDAKGYSPSVKVLVDIDRGDLDRSMQSLEQEFSRRSAYLNRQKIVAQVDDSQLTALNQHLTVKEQHLDRVVAKFANTQIAPRVNTDGFDQFDRSLDILNRRVAQVRESMAQPMGIAGLDGTVRDMRVRMVIDDRQLRQQITVNLDINGNELSRSVEDSIKKGFKGVKASGGNLLDVVTSVPKTIVRGFQEGIGLTYAQSLTKGTIRGLEEQFGASLDRVGQSIGNRAGQVGKTVGNGLIQRAGFGGTEDVKAKLSELNEAFIDLFPTGILEKKLQKIESRLMKIIDNMTRLRPVEEQIQGVQGFAGAIGELQEVPKQGLKNRRAKQVRKYAEQVKQSGEGEKVDIADDVHTIVIATGGFAGQKGKSSGMVGKKLQSLMGDGYHVVSVDNTNTDVSMPLQEAGVPRWLAEGGGKIAKNKLVDGINPDAVTMATLANQLQQQYPDKKIKFAGFSSGGIVANDATELFQATGGKAEGVAIGSPIFNNAAKEKPDTFSAVLRKEDGVNKVAKKIEQVTGIGLNKKVTTMTEGEGHELALYLSDPKSQRVILDRLGSKNEPLRNKSAADFDVINYKEQAEKSIGDLGHQLANPIRDPKVNRILLEQKLAGIKETRASIKQSLPQVQEGKAELIEYLQALNEANALLNRVLKLQSIPVIGTPEPKQARRLPRSPIDTEPTDDPWSDNYREPRLIVKSPFEDGIEKVSARRRARQSQNTATNQETSSFEFVNAPSLGVKNTASGGTDKLSSAIDKFDRAVDKFANNQKKESNRSTKKEEIFDGEFEYIEQSTGSKVLSAARQGLNLASQPIGQIGSVASGAEKALFEAVPILKPLKGAMQIGGTLAIGGAISQNPVGQAAIAGTSHMMQSIAGAPISQFAGMTSSAIEQILGSALTHLPGGAGLAQSIAVEVQRALQSGGAQAAGAIVSVLSPYLVAKLGMGAAGAGLNQLMPGLAGDERVTASTQRNLMGAGRAVKQLMPVTTIEPFWDVEATAIEDRQLPQGKKIKSLPPAKSTKPSKSFNPEWPRIVEESLKETQSQLEQAIKNGELDLAKQYHARLKEQVAGAHKLVNVGLSSDKLSDADKQHLTSSVRGNLTKKSKFLANSGEAIETMEFSDADPSDVKGKIGWSEKLKRSVAQGIRRNMGQGNNDAGFINLGAHIPALDFLDTPVQEIIPNIKSAASKLFARNQPTYTSAPSPSIQQTTSAAIEKSETALSKLIGVGKLALGVFGGFTALSLGVPAMISLGKSTLDTAKNFETLQVKLAAASDSAQAGRNSFARITNKADELGVSRSGALEVGAGIAGTTFGTELEGKPSDILTDKTLQFFKSRGLNKQQQEGFQLAATQTLGRKNLSGQEVNQFIQSAGIADTRSIAARGMGLTPAQFAAMQDGPGIDSKKFMQAFLSQGVQDARTGEALASQTAGYKESQLSAKTEVLQGSIGAGISPAYKAGIDLLTNSIELLNAAIGNGKSALIGFAINGLLFAGAGLVKLASQFGLPAVAMATFKSVILANATQIGNAMVKMGVQFAAFYVLGEGIQLLGKKWSNSAQEIEDSANKIATALSKLDKNKTPDLTKPQTAADVQGEGWLDAATLWAQRNITNPIAQKQQDIGNAIVDNPFSVGLRKQLGITAQKPEQSIVGDNKQKEDQEFRESIDKVSYNTKLSIGASERAGRKGKQMAEVDLAINQIDTERSGLYASGSPDAGKIAELNKRYNEKFKERGVLDEDTAPAKAAAQEAINAIKGAQSFLDKKNEAGQIGQDTYLSKTAQLKIDLKAAEDAQRKLNDAIRSGFDNLTPWVNTLNKIAARFEDISIAANSSKERLAITRNAGEIGGRLTKGTGERQAVIDNDRITESEIKSRRQTVAELTGGLNAKDPKNVANVQKAYGLNDASSSAQIKIAAGLATSTTDKTTLEKLAVIKDEQLKIATLDANLSNSHAETYRRIYAENREAALYYTQLSQQIDPKGVMFAKNISAITAEKARFMAKLSNYGTGGFDVYTTAIIDLMDVAKERMTALAKLAADKRAALDAATNRNNDIAGKRQNDFDTTPGTQQPAVGKVSGSVQNSGNNAPQVGTSQPQSVNTPYPAIQLVESALPPKTIKVTRSKTFTDANEYTDSPNPQIQSNIRAQLAKFPKADVDRYVNTNQAIGSRTYDANGKPNGYTDLGLDEFDRKILGLNDRGKPQGIPISTVDGRQLRSPFSEIDSKPVAGSNRSSKRQQSKITVEYEEEITNPEYKKAVDAQNKRRASNTALQPAANQVTPQSTQTSSGRLTTGQLRDKSQLASDRITQDALDRSNATFSEFEPGEALKQNQIRLKLDRESRLAQQAAAKQLRDQESTQLNAVPAISIQDTQKRETLSQRNALTDNRDSVSNARIDMTSQIQNIEISIAEFNQLSQKKNRTQGENAVLEQLKIAVPKLSKDLPILRQALGRLQVSEANLPANDAKAIAALQEQQTYNLGKQKETEEQDRRATENTQLRGKLTDVDQQLTNAPLDQDKLKNQRELNKQIVIREAEITRINAERAITERSRSDASYYPKQQASDRARVKLIEQNTIKNAGNKQAQDSIKAANNINQEFATADIAELKLGQSSGDLGVRFQQSQDKIDAPFASTRSLDLELRQKLSAIENAKVERNKQFEQQRIKYTGTSEANIKLLASLDRQKKEADRQSEVEKKVVETDSGIAVRGVQSQRKGYLYGQQKATFNQQIGIYDAQTTGDKQRGSDTRDREYTSAVLRKKSDYSQQEFDLRQQRDAITGLTPEADIARSSIDSLIAGLKQMESIELSNMANQFDRFNQVLGETQKTTQSVLEKFVKTGKFDWKSILRTPLEGGISQIMGKIVPAKPVDPLAITPVIPAPSDKIERAAEQIITQPDQAAITPASRSILDSDGMANIPMPNGGNYRIPRSQAISEGFMRLDGSSTSHPEIKPEIKIAPLDPQTIAAPEVTIEPIAPQTIPAPTDDTGFDIRQLPLKGRSNIVDFKPKFDPNESRVVAPPMPANQLEGKPGYIPQSNIGGSLMGLISSTIGGGKRGGGNGALGLLSSIGGLFGLSFADGGMVPTESKFNQYRQGDDPIARALQKEGSNSVIAALTPGERVLTVSESRYYETMFPQGIKGYADGGVVGNIKPIPLNLDQRKIDSRGDTNNFNFDIADGDGKQGGKMGKEQIKDFENAVTAVMLKHKRARSGLVPN